MALQQFDLNRAGETPIATLKLGEITPKDWHRYPPPVDNMTLANPDAAKPRYDGAGAAADWHGGTDGNDIDAADSTQAIVDANGTVMPDYEPRHQEEKAAALGVPMATDIGKDYGEFTGLTGRDGEIEPRDPYPVAPPPEPEP